MSSFIIFADKTRIKLEVQQKHQTTKIEHMALHCCNENSDGKNRLTYKTETEESNNIDMFFQDLIASSFLPTNTSCPKFESQVKYLQYFLFF